MTDNVTILTCRSSGALATKKFSIDADGNVIKQSFGAGLLFERETVAVSSVMDLHDVLVDLQDKSKKFIIRGEPKPTDRKFVHRRLQSEHAAFEPKPRQWLMLDIDKLPIPLHLDAKPNPDQVVEWVLMKLPDIFHDVTCVYKFSSSQNVPKVLGETPPSVVSIHLMFWCDRAVDEQEWKCFFKENPSPVDRALFSAVQIHYTAAPIFEGFENPLSERLGLYQGKNDTVPVPEIPEPDLLKPTERSEMSLDIADDAQNKAIELLCPSYKEGERNRFCGAVAGALYRGGWEAEEVANFVYQLAETASDEEASARYDNALRICNAIDEGCPAQGIPTLREEFEVEDLDKILSILGVGKLDVNKHISGLSKASSPEELEQVLKLVLSSSVSEQALYIEDIIKETGQKAGVINKIFKALKRENDNRFSADRSVALVEELLRSNYERGRLLLRADDSNFWGYNGRYWEVVSEDALKKQLLPLANEIRKFHQHMNVSSDINCALSLLKGRVYKGHNPFKTDGFAPMVINCRNGEVWFDESGDKNFRPHRPESYLRNCLDVDYDPDAQSPEFDRAVREIFGKSKDPENMFRHFMELMGYICQPWRRLPIILLLHGSGSNGKSSLVEILEKLLGDGNYMADRINDIEKHIFKIGALDGKLMLIDDDVEMGVCLPDGFLKKISEEKTLTGQHKNKPSFEFRCRSLPVMLSNHYPSIKDLSDGFARRIMVVPFTRKFKKSEIIPGLFEKIWREEASGILNHVIAGFQRLKKRNKFEAPQDCVRAKNIWMARSNELVTYIEEYCKEGENLKQSVKELYSNFKDYCEEAGVKKFPSRKGFRERLESLGYEIYQLNGYPTVRGLYAPSWEEADNTGELLTGVKMAS